MGGLGKPDVYGNVFLAPNGRSVAVDKTDMESMNTDIWSYDLQRDSSQRLTFDPAIDAVPIWSPMLRGCFLARVANSARTCIRRKPMVRKKRRVS